MDAVCIIAGYAVQLVWVYALMLSISSLNIMYKKIYIRQEYVLYIGLVWI